jgi:hypothetical protein
MQLLDSFDLMQNPLFSMQKKVDDANSVYLERCRGYQATIKIAHRWSNIIPTLQPKKQAELLK